ncbi:SRPBCC family protein [Oscillatoria sp. FACHB-1406]|uniref:SRPBCC family protein n=1 Tax=Oscillatoria sp. FACHB-1406 TaxID=2692846 RepID=UPI001687D01F|nr:SRPBCC family protein [Oscillatoria sp. FACHB-1406]MBD2579279.1 SRPBCC family protein [Oscillatoria sp. FACHB-1406]
MIFNFSFKLVHDRGRLFSHFALYKRYRAVSNARIDVLWQKLINLADVSWHPLISSTNAPEGLTAKPGLIYQVVTRLTPFPIQIFVESVKPQELLSVRFLALPGVENRVTYQIESTLCGTYVSYSITLRGWLSPLVWLCIRPYVARVASELARAADRIIDNGQWTMDN